MPDVLRPCAGCKTPTHCDRGGRPICEQCIWELKCQGCGRKADKTKRHLKHEPLVQHPQKLILCLRCAFATALLDERPARPSPPGGRATSEAPSSPR